MATISLFMGSTRAGRVGDHVAHFIAEALKARKHTVHLIDPNTHKELQTLHIPNHYNKQPSADMKQLHTWLQESDGFILVSPEYNHSFSGALKNALDNFMPEYEKKPFGIATYSVGPFGGIRANEALRPVVSELKGVPTPLPFMMSNVGEAFDEHGKLKDAAYTERLNKFLDDFEWYCRALAAARK
jgi:NAD(P)H-dependent FMN reductase